MSSAELEIYQAIRQLKSTPTVIRSLCLICKEYLNDWDVQAHKAVCWKCRRISFQKSKIELPNPEPKKATLFQLRDGKYAIVID